MRNIDRFGTELIPFLESPLSGACCITLEATEVPVVSSIYDACVLACCMRVVCVLYACCMRVCFVSVLVSWQRFILAFVDVIRACARVHACACMNALVDTVLISILGVCLNTLEQAPLKRGSGGRLYLIRCIMVWLMYPF